MIDIINFFIDNYNIPLLTAFLLGVLTSISPCPLATNITAIAYISKEIKNPKNVFISGISYTLGRAFSYTLLAFIIYFGFSSFDIATFFQGWGDKLLGPFLILISLIMMGVIRINIGRFGGGHLEKVKVYLSQKGNVGSFLLGVLFALAFCPYSGVIFFGALIPLMIASYEGLLLPPLFALGTGIPVIIFSIIIAFSVKKIGQTFKMVQKIEKIMRYLVALVFLIVGIYYSLNIF